MSTAEPRAVHPPDKMASVRIVKQFTYREVARQFSNRYHIGVNFPQTPAAWKTLIDNVAGAETDLFPPLANGGAKIVAGYGLGPNSNIPVHEETYNYDGVLAHDTWSPSPGDAAAIVKYTTPDRSIRNHPIYLWSYYHAVGAQPGVDGDKLNTVQHAAIQAYANAWLTGFSDGSTTYRRSRPNNGTIATAATCELDISHRDLPRA
jgi:hypothetical protein